MTNIDRLTRFIKDFTEAQLCAQMDGRTASHILEDDRTKDAIMDFASALDALIDYGTEYQMARNDLEADGLPTYDSEVDRLLEKRGVEFPL